MLFLTVFYSIPEFDVSTFFLLSCSSGKLNGIGNVSSLNDTNRGHTGSSVSGGSASASGASVPASQDSERMRLKAPGTGGPKYTQQVNDTNELQVRRK